MVKKTGPKRGVASGKGKKRAKTKDLSHKATTPKSLTTESKAKPKSTARKAAQKVRTASKLELENAIMLVMTTITPGRSITADQIRENVKIRLKQDAPRDRLIDVLSSLGKTGKLVLHYSPMVVRAVKREDVRAHRPGIALPEAAGSDAADDSADDSHTLLEGEILVVICKPPREPLLPGEIRERVNCFFGTEYSRDLVNIAVDRLSTRRELEDAGGGRFKPKRCP
jgi:hypothetical protein